MSIGHAIILGIVEGITEFLPISSTGHLILAGKVLGIAHSEFLSSFNIAIQLGAIAAVVVLYGKTLLCNPNVLKRILAAFIPTAIIGFVFYKLIKGYLLGNAYVVVWSLLFGGLFLVIFELLYKGEKGAASEIERISYKQAVLIGLFQSVAMVPGVSRAAATIIGGLILGLKRRTIVEFSFILAVPTMLAATAYDLLKSSHAFSRDQWGILAVGLITSFIVAVAGIKFLLYFIKNHSFVSFGIYRIIIAVLFLFLLNL